MNFPELSLQPFPATKVKSGPLLFVFVVDKTDQDLKALKESMQPRLAALAEIRAELQGETKERRKNKRRYQNQAKVHYKKIKRKGIMKTVQRIFSLLVIIGLTITFLGCAATSKKESTGQYIDDSVITTKVKKAIFEEPGLKTMQIEVKTFKGVVQLSGFVDTPQSVTRAGEVAATVDGVKSVENDLIVK